MAAYFISDIHLMNKEDPNVEGFASALDKMKPDATHILLLGDIFDLWVGGSEWFAKEFAPIVDRLKTMKENGVKIYFIEGNHDFHLYDYWTKVLGAEIFASDHELELFGKKVRIEHGDFINPDDTLYFKWRWFMRSPFIKYPAKVVPGQITAWIGNNLSSISRKRTRSREHAPHVKEDIKRKFKIFSEKRIHEYDFDLMVTGHVHVQQDIEVQNGTKSARSVNLGFWDKPKAFRLDESSAEFVYF